MVKKIKVVDVESNLEQPVQVSEPVQPSEPEPVQPSEPVVQSEENLKPIEEEHKVKKKRSPKKTVDKNIHELSEMLTKDPAEGDALSVALCGARCPAREIVVEPVKVDPPVEPVKVVEPVQAVEPPKENKNIKTVELVECPDCHKKLTQRTLKYSHQSVCPAKKPPKQEQVSEPKRVKKPVEEVQHIEEEYMASEPVGGVRRQITRVIKKSDKFKHLVANAF